MRESRVFVAHTGSNATLTAPAGPLLGGRCLLDGWLPAPLNLPPLHDWHLGPLGNCGGKLVLVANVFACFFDRHKGVV